MIMHIPRSTPETLTERIDELLRVIEKTLPKPIQDDILAVYSASTEEMFVQAEQDLYSSALDWSRAGDETPHAFFETNYVKCILCNRNVASRRGIEEHLSSYKECPVFGAIIDQAKQRYAKTEAREQDERRQRAADSNRENDRVLVDLATKSEPRDSYGWRRRSAGELTFALDRLTALGFTEISEPAGTATVTRWELQVGGIYLLADPRHKGSISFKAWTNDTLERYRQGKKVYRVRELQINDGWRKELRKKLMQRVEDALEMKDGALEEFYADPRKDSPKVDASSTLKTTTHPTALIEADAPMPASGPATAVESVMSFENLSHADVLAKSRSMSRKALIEKYRLTPAQASARINAAVEWEKSQK